MVNDENIIRLKKPDMFSLERTLDCGQAFRWESDESGVFSGVAYGKVMRVKEEGDSLLFYGMKNEDVQGVFYRYLDLERNYRSLQWRQISVGGRKSLPRYQNFASGAVGGTLLVYNFAKQQYSAYKGNNKKAL